MGLSTKKPTRESQELSKKMTGVATRIAYLSDDEMKQLKIKSITENIDIQNLIDSALKQITSNNNCQFKAISVNAKKRSFAINRERLKEIKMFLLGCNGVTQDKLIYNAILKIIE
jgi:hypothetical protein